jgi:hypothetical protein
MPKKKEKISRGTDMPSRDSSPAGILSRYPRWAPIAAVCAVILIATGIVVAARKPSTSSPAAPRATVTHTPPLTATTDPCATEIIRPDVETVDAVMSEFYDASALASQTPIDQLLGVIPNLQEIRRRAQALKVSPCLDTLRSYQISHMNMVINTMLSFLGKADQSVLMEGIVQARLLNEAYKKEKARLLGVPYVPPPTPTPAPTQGTVTITPSSTR